MSSLVELEETSQIGKKLLSFVNVGDDAIKKQCKEALKKKQYQQRLLYNIYFKH